ncbi:MAG: hypothetical protein ACP5JV_11095 [Thermus sp.]|uniref:hypothetical protein n=1 Tax=Thermus sp. TaxID=275 RepID=UPI003D099559
MSWEEEKKALEAQFLEDLAWYEREWEACRQKLEEERQEWNAARKQLLSELSECSKKVRELKARLKALEGLEGRCSALQGEVQGLTRKLSALSRPAIGRRYLEALREELALWDERLLEEAEHVQARGLEGFLQALWARREEAFRCLQGGEEVNFAAVRTALVLEWAIWTWLEAGWNPGGTP